MAKLLLNVKSTIKRKIYQGFKIGIIIFKKDNRNECKEFRLNLKRKNNIKFLTKLTKSKKLIKKDNKAAPIKNKSNKIFRPHR